MSIAKLIEKIHANPLYWEICRTIHYCGFPFPELFGKMKPLVDKFGARKVSAALTELASHIGWHTMLSADARKACFSIIGPAPEQWDTFYTDWQGKPTPRPPQHQTPPVIPPAQPDPILDGLTRFTATELDMKLRMFRAALKKEIPAHERQLCEETIPRIESEMVRRGQDLPPDEKEKPKTEQAPKKRRTRKEKA